MLNGSSPVLANTWKNAASTLHTNQPDSLRHPWVGLKELPEYEFLDARIDADDQN